MHSVRSILLQTATDPREHSVLHVQTAKQLHDPKLGGHAPCPTCGSLAPCEGHFGHIELCTATTHPLLGEQVDCIAVPPLPTRPPTDKQPTHPVTAALRAVLHAKTKEKLDDALNKYFRGDPTQPSHAANFALAHKWKGKEGYFRKQILGRRCNFSARAVCTPDAHLPAGTVGLPKQWAGALTTERKGPCARLPHGALVRDGNRLVHKREASATQTYVRPLRDGDTVLLNRQPSLHKGSMLCMRVKLLDGHTIRFSPAHCNSLNADFDGDEVNIHVLQRQDAREQAEAHLRPEIVTAAMQDTATLFADAHEYNHEQWQQRQDEQDARGLSVTLADVEDPRGGSLADMVRAGKGKQHHLQQVQDSFKAGMRPRQLFENATQVRRGLVGTYCSTPEAGYLARKLCAMLEDVRSHGECLVNASGRVVAFRGAERTRTTRPGVHEAQMIAHELTQSYLDAFHNVGGSHGDAADTLRVVNGPPRQAQLALPELTLYQAVYNFVRHGEPKAQPKALASADDLREALADNPRADTNNLDFVAEALGIEAARAKLLQMLPSRELYADVVTAEGNLLYAHRRFIQKTEQHPLAAAAFETALPTLVKAAKASTTDPLTHPTSQIVVRGFPV